MKYGYIRVSHKTQDETRQRIEIEKMGVLPENCFVDKASGKTFIGREAWEKLLTKLTIGDVIVIHEIDRLGRDNKEIKETFELIGKKGVFFEFIDQPLLNTINRSQIERELIQPLVLHLLGYYAEKEREKILKRQKEAYDSLEKDNKGRLISRKKKIVVGRPNKIENLTKEEIRLVNLWLKGEIKRATVLKTLNISIASLYRVKNMIIKNNV